MIVQEHYFVGDHKFVRTTSDAGRYVVRDGVSYSEACDPVELNRQYTEGNLMPLEELPDHSEDAEALIRYANELTGATDETLLDATETLIKHAMEGR